MSDRVPDGMSDDRARAPPAWSEAESELQVLYGRALLGLGFLDAELRVLRASDGLASLLATTQAALTGVPLAAAPLDGLDGLVAGAVLALKRNEPVLAIPLSLPGGQADVDFVPTRGRDDAPPCLAVIATPTGAAEPAVLVARRAALAEVLARMTRRLLDSAPGTLPEQVQRELEGLAGALRLDYAFVGEFSAPPGRTSRTVGITSAWATPIDAFTERLSASALPWASAQLQAGRAILCYVADDIPPEGRATRSLLDDLGLQSLLALPLVVRDHTIGFLALARRRTDPNDPAITFWLRLVADVLASALERDRLDQDRAKALADLEAARELLEGERDYLREELGQSAQPASLIAHSPKMRAATDLLRAVASSDATVLLQGETGVGKELFAAVLHGSSARARGPFVRVNCAAIPRELFESEFFGHTRGAFTGALKDRKGRFELAQHGTLFLDEVGEIPLDAQAKLLRVLEEGTFERVGEGTARRADARIVAATNLPLERLVEDGRFRQDLYYRLSVFPITVPALRERLEDLPALAQGLLDEARRRFRRGLIELDAEALERLAAYRWPGNVRELRNVIERAVLLSGQGPLRVEVGEPAARPTPPRERPAASNSLAPVRELERATLEEALRAAGGRIAGADGAAARVGLPPSTFRDRLKRFGISLPRT